jgi:hypothetical protein
MAIEGQMIDGDRMTVASHNSHKDRLARVHLKKLDPLTIETTVRQPYFSEKLRRKTARRTDDPNPFYPESGQTKR